MPSLLLAVAARTPPHAQYTCRHTHTHTLSFTHTQIVSSAQVKPVCAVSCRVKPTLRRAPRRVVEGLPDAQALPPRADGARAHGRRALRLAVEAGHATEIDAALKALDVTLAYDTLEELAALFDFRYLTPGQQALSAARDEQLRLAQRLRDVESQATATAAACAARRLLRA